MRMEIEHRRARGADLHLHYVAAGTGEPVVLLHGFPDFWFGWRHQIQPLAAAGYRVLAPDLRGYNLSDRPRGVRHYDVSLLVRDVAEFLRDAVGGPAAVVGHDWGGIVAWQLAARQPQLVRRLAILNAPHPDRYMRVLRRHPAQLLRSWYVLFNQLPVLPELLMRRRRFALLRRIVGTDEDGRRMASDAELAEYVRAFERAGALTAALNYYRAAFRRSLRMRGSPAAAVRVPTLIVWGERDPYLDPRLLDGLDRWVENLRLCKLPHVGHFLHWQDAGTVNELLLTFLRE